MYISTDTVYICISSQQTCLFFPQIQGKLVLLYQNIMLVFVSSLTERREEDLGESKNTTLSSPPSPLPLSPPLPPTHSSLKLFFIQNLILGTEQGILKYFLLPFL